MAVVGTIEFFHHADQGKPYSLRFEPLENIPRLNYTSKLHDQQIEDIRGHEASYTITENGFQIISIEPKLSYEEFDDANRIQAVFYQQVAHALQEALGATRIQIFEHVLRKRHQTFPIATGLTYDHDQPTTRAHLAWGTSMAQTMNQEYGDELPSKRYKFINLWKPLRGPVRDWPLAVCDVRTVEPADIIASDLVYPTIVVENCMVRSNEGQRWYYLHDQTEQEAWIFVQADSDPTGQLGAPHSSFRHPQSQQSDLPRESIEVRAIAYF